MNNAKNIDKSNSLNENMNHNLNRRNILKNSLYFDFKVSDVFQILYPGQTNTGM